MPFVRGLSCPHTGCRDKQTILEPARAEPFPQEGDLGGDSGGNWVVRRDQRMSESSAITSSCVSDLPCSTAVVKALGSSMARHASRNSKSNVLKSLTSKGCNTKGCNGLSSAKFCSLWLSKTTACLKLPR